VVTSLLKRHLKTLPIEKSWTDPEMQILYYRILKVREMINKQNVSLFVGQSVRSMNFLLNSFFG